VIQELLHGFDDERAFVVARDALHALPIVESPMPAAIYDDAAGLYRRAWRGGFTVRSSVDCLIAACAIRHRLEVLHVDRDFDALVRVSALRSRRAKIRKP